MALFPRHHCQNTLHCFSLFHFNNFKKQNTHSLLVRLDSCYEVRVFTFWCFFTSRPHKADESGQKSLKRMIWEIYHINAGRLALLLALINISLGVFLAVVPYTAWVIWFVMFALWVAVLIVMEIRLQYHRYKSSEGNMVEMTNKWSLHTL